MLIELRVSYEVSPVTLAILSEKIDGRHVSLILESDETEDSHVGQSPLKIMDLACRFYGSSLKGRQDGTRDICGITHKAPISVDPSSGMYFFPTTSPQNPKCAWIAHSHVGSVIKAPNHCTKIIFKNGRSLTLEVSHGSILNQVHRTAQYRYLLDKRIKYLLKNNVDIVAEPPFFHDK